MTKSRVRAFGIAMGLTFTLGVRAPVRAEPSALDAVGTQPGFKLAGRPVSGAMTERSAIQSIEDALDAYGHGRLSRAEDYYAAATYLSQSNRDGDRALAADLALVALDKGFMPARTLVLRVHRDSRVAAKRSVESSPRNWEFKDAVMRPGTAPLL